jgi:hypothetical protein
MLGETLVGAQLRDLRSVLAWLRTRDELDSARVAVWGDSLAPVNKSDTNFVVPRDDDAALPAQSEPLGGLLALLTGLYEDGVQAIYIRGGLAGFRSVLEGHVVLIPHDVIVPGVLTTGDLSDVAAVLAPRSLRLEGTVDGWNRRLGERQVRVAYQLAIDVYREHKAPTGISIQEETASPARWLLSELQKK